MKFKNYFPQMYVSYLNTYENNHQGRKENTYF